MLSPIVPPITQPPLMAAMNGGDVGAIWTRRPRHSSFTRATPVRCGHTPTMPALRADCARVRCFLTRWGELGRLGRRVLGNALRASEWLNEIAEQRVSRRPGRTSPKIRSTGAGASDRAAGRGCRGRSEQSSQEQRSCRAWSRAGSVRSSGCQTEEVSLDTALTRIGSCRVPKPPGAASSDPFRVMGIRERPISPTSRFRRETEADYRRGWGPGEALLNSPSVRPPMAEPMTQPQSAPSGGGAPAGGGAPSGGPIRRGSTIGRWRPAPPGDCPAANRMACRSCRPTLASAGGSPRRRRGVAVREPEVAAPVAAPSSPLQPAVGAETVAPAPSGAARGATVAGAARAAVGGAIGGDGADGPRCGCRPGTESGATRTWRPTKTSTPRTSLDRGRHRQSAS